MIYTVTSSDKACIVSRDIVNLQCLQCGTVTSGNLISIVECPRCGGLDYHIFKMYIPITEAAAHRRDNVPDNKGVINHMMELVKGKTS